jgi:hypothetical protein
MNPSLSSFPGTPLQNQSTAYVRVERVVPDALRPNLEVGVAE